MARALSDARRRDATRGRCDAYISLPLSSSVSVRLSLSLSHSLAARCSPFLPLSRLHVSVTRALFDRRVSSLLSPPPLPHQPCLGHLSPFRRLHSPPPHRAATLLRGAHMHHVACVHSGIWIRVCAPHRGSIRRRRTRRRTRTCRPQLLHSSYSSPPAPLVARDKARSFHNARSSSPAGGDA